MSGIKPCDKENVLATRSESFGPWGKAVKIRWIHVFLFALLSRDFQWIHLNPWKAKKGPYGGLIAHGALTLAMLNRFVGKRLHQMFDASRIVDLGKDKIRNTCVVHVGRSLRLRYRVAAARVVDSEAFVDYELQVGFQADDGDVIVLECRAKLLYA